MFSSDPTRQSVWERALHGAFVFILTACGGGGCGDCGCGVEPIPGGFPIDQRIPNSAQIRLTQGGIEFIEDNAAALVPLFVPDGLDFDVPRTEQSVGIGDVVICPDEDCVARITIPTAMEIGGVDAVEIDPMDPNVVSVHVRLILDSRNTAGERARWDVEVPGPDCTLDVNTRAAGLAYVGADLSIALEEETELARAGYTRAVVQSVALDESEPLDNGDLDVDGPGFSLCSAANLGFVKDFLIGQLEDQVGELAQSAIDDQLCTTTGTAGCPTGTCSDDPADPDATCRFGAPAGGTCENSDDRCVPILLGTDGQGDLGEAFLGSVSPGTHAPGQFLLASGGEGEAVNEGMSLFFYGGFLGTSRDFSVTPAHNPCVPAIDPPPIPTIPRVNTFRANSIPGLATDPHVSIGLSESFLNHAGYGMYDGGLLCIGAGTPLSQQLSTGLFSLLIPSLNRLTFPQRSAPIAIMIRPQRPPTFEVGAGTELDPTLTVTLEELQMDFYVWGNERYVRFMTFQADLAIPINLSVVDGEIVPNIPDLSAANAVVTNSEDLLTENPEMLAGTIESILSTFAGMALGDLGGFALPDLMGLELDVQDGGIRGIEEDGEEFLGIFANLRAPGAMALSAPVQTRLLGAEFEQHERAMRIESWASERNRLHLHMDAEGPEGVEYEYSARLDGMSWTPWQTDPHVVLDHEALLLQAKHTAEVRARVVGERESVDPTPAVHELIVDLEAPTIVLQEAETGTKLLARDVVSPDALRYRWRDLSIEGSAFSEWMTLGDEDPVLPSRQVEVEVMDEVDNVGSATNALIRGRPNPAAEGACACALPGQEDHRPVAGILLLGLFVALRRRTNDKDGAK